VDAAAKGAGLGLEASKIATESNEAADRLRQSYAALAAQQSMHAQSVSAESARASAALALHGAIAKAADDARLSRLGLAGRHQDMLEQNEADRLKTANAARYLHISGGLHKLDPATGNITTLIAPPVSVDPFTRMKYQSALNRAKSARVAMNRPDLDPSTKTALQAELEDANREIQAIEAGHSKGGASTADPSASLNLNSDGSPFSAVGWSPGSNAGWSAGGDGSAASGLTLPNEADTGRTLPGLGETDDGAPVPPPAPLKIGKYKVTPLQ
jgi:hypothetical protein